MNKKWATTADFIQYGKVSGGAGTILETEGFYIVGVGAGKWKKTGITGVTPVSQTPSVYYGNDNSKKIHFVDSVGDEWIIVGEELDINSIGGDFYTDTGTTIILPEGFSSSFSGVITDIVKIDPSVTWAEATNSGSIEFLYASYSNQGKPSHHRLNGRVFIGESANYFAGDGGIDGGTSWLSDSAASPAYTAKNSHLVVTNEQSNYAATFGVRTGNNTGAAGIAASLVTLNDKVGGRTWGFIAEMQHEDGALVSNGFEIAAKNKSSSDLKYTPYLSTTGVFGGRIVAGGDDLFGGSPTNPSNSALIIIENTHTWNNGIVFRQTALTGTDGTALNTGRGDAILMARNHQISWYAPDGNPAVNLLSTITDSTKKVEARFTDNGFSLFNALGDNKVQFTMSQSAGTAKINFFTDASSAQILAEGSATDYDLRLRPKGAGVVRFGTHTAIGAETVTGYIMIKDETGTLRKVAVVS